MPDSLWNYLMWALLLFTSFGVVYPLSFGFMPILYGLLCTALLYFVAKKRININRHLLYAFIGLIILFFSSSLWAYNAEETISRSIKVSILLLGSLPLIGVLAAAPESSRQIFIKWFPVSLILQASIVSIELYYNFPLYRLFTGVDDIGIPTHILNKHAGTLIMLLPFGLFFSLSNKRFMTVAILSLVTLILLFKTDSQAAQLAVIIGLLAYALCKVMPRLFIPGVFAFAIFILVAMPFMAPVAFDKFAEGIHENGKISRQASSDMRLENYDFISKKIMEKPVTGFGMDATRFMTFETEKKFFPSDTIMHPHNMALQVWIEFGVIGIVTFSGLFVFLYLCIQRSNPHDRCLFVTVFCVAIVFLMVSWSIWASWFVGLLLFLIGLSALSRSRNLAAD